MLCNNYEYNKKTTTTENIFLISDYRSRGFKPSSSQNKQVFFLSLITGAARSIHPACHGVCTTIMACLQRAGPVVLDS